MDKLNLPAAVDKKDVLGLPLWGRGTASAVDEVL